MEDAGPSPRVIRFATFEVDLRAGELRKAGMKVKLTGQPFQVLTILLEHPGEVVTREELQKRLWPDTFVDVDHNLNTAINKIREVIGDSAESPRFVETLPRRGYRFIGALQEPPALQGTQGRPVLPAHGAPSPEKRDLRRRPDHRLGILIGVTMLFLAGGLWLFYSTRRSGPVTSPSEYTQLTNLTDSAVSPSLSPDGRMVTFKRGEDSFFSTGQIYVQLLPDGDPVRLTNNPDLKYAPVFTPDGSRIAYTSVADTWDTWTVPVLGGQPTRFLPNATALTWLKGDRILFSEIKTGLHMGVVASTENRANRHEIYFPANERAMAHYAYASPDVKSVLIVEMDQTHVFHQQCRLVPFDGSSTGRQVGPRGTCTAAAWSPDGTWMYLGATVGRSSHLWRQKFPDGAPEQITFGPSEEEGVAVAPDGRSLVTSVGARRSSLWIHDSAGERPISSEGYATALHLSKDGAHVFYLFAHDLVLSAMVGWRTSNGELRSVDLKSGKIENVLPGMLITDYSISPDESEVAFTTTDGDGKKNIWLSALNRRTPPRQVTSGDQVSFGSDGYLVFRSLEEKTNKLARIRKDGRNLERINTALMLEKYAVSPDGAWVVVFSPSAVPNALPSSLAVPLNGGAPQKICTPDCWSGWSSDGRFFYVAPLRGEKTYVIPVPSGKSLPDLPPSGFNLEAEDAVVPGARVIERGRIALGRDPSVYVFLKTDIQRNLFRIPLH